MSDKDKQKGQKGVLFFIIAFLADLGFFIAIFLTYIHYQVYNSPDFEVIGCQIGQKFNCKAVALSSYSIFLGAPISVWGSLVYLAISLAAIFIALKGQRGEEFDLNNSPLFGILWSLSVVSFATSIAMSYISHVIIKALCPWCMGLYVISILLMILVIAAQLSYKVNISNALKSLFSSAKDNIAFVLLGAIAIFAISAFYPKYWSSASLGLKGPSLKRGEDNGVPWIGAEQPKATLIIFSDYECPYCRRAQRQLSSLLQKYKGKLRLVHRHFPLDNKCNRQIKGKFHEHACFLAAAAVCAEKYGKFWEASSFLYQYDLRNLNRDDLIEELAKLLKIDPKSLRQCTLRSETYSAIKRDIELGIEKYKIRGTPTFILNGKIYYLGPKLLKAIERAIGETAPQK